MHPYIAHLPQNNVRKIFETPNIFHEIANDPLSNKYSGCIPLRVGGISMHLLTVTNNCPLRSKAISRQFLTNN